MTKKISIITITLNSDKYLEQAIESVRSQTFPNKEYIIIDGGSTDNTLELIKRHVDVIDVCISEPDKGIADAMNKGFALASGDFIIFLHSDDYFVDPNTLSKAVDYLSTDFDIFLFDIILSNKDRKRVYSPRGLNWWMNFKTGVFHQSSICSRALFEKIGNFDISLRIAMDYDFFLRAYRSGVKAKKIDFPLSVMRTSGVSSRMDWGSLAERFGEERQIHRKNCRGLLHRALYRIYWLLYLPYRRILAFSKPGAAQ